MQEYSEHRLAAGWKDNIREKPVVFEYAETLLVFCFIYPVAVLIDSIAGQNPAIYIKAFALLAGFLLFTFLRLKCRRLYQLLAAGFALMAFFMIVSPNLMEKVLSGAILLITLIVSVNKYLREIRRREFSYEHSSEALYALFIGRGTLICAIILLYLTYMSALIFHFRGVVTASFIAFVLFVAGYQIYGYLTGRYCLSVWEDGEQNASVQATGRFGALFSSFLAVLALLAGWVSYSVVYATGLNRVDQAVINFFLEQRKPINAPPPKVTYSASSAAQGINPNMLPKTGSSPLTAWIGVLIKVLMPIVAAACFLVILLLLIRAVRTFLKIGRTDTGGTRTAAPKKKVAHETRMYAGRRRLLPDLLSGNSNRMKIRRSFRKFVRRHMRATEPVQESDAPAEISRKIAPGTGPDLMRATALYEKARYGATDSSPEDARAMRAALAKAAEAEPENKE